MKIFCPNCGKESIGSNKYCSECGYDLTLIKQSNGIPVDEYGTRTTTTNTINLTNNNGQKQLGLLALIFAIIFPLVGLIIGIVALNNAKKLENSDQQIDPDFIKKEKKYSKIAISIGVIIILLNILPIIIAIIAIIKNPSSFFETDSTTKENTTVQGVPYDPSYNEKDSDDDEEIIPIEGSYRCKEVNSEEYTIDIVLTKNKRFIYTYKENNEENTLKGKYTVTANEILMKNSTYYDVTMIPDDQEQELKYFYRVFLRDNNKKEIEIVTIIDDDNRPYTHICEAK